MRSNSREDTLHNRVIQAAALNGHAADDLVFLEQVPVVGGSILAPLIRVDEQLLRFCPAVAEGTVAETVKGIGDLVHQQAALRLTLEIPTTALDPMLLQPVFPEPERPLDQAALVGDTAVVAGSGHSEVGAELVVVAGVAKYPYLGGEDVGPETLAVGDALLSASLSVV